MSTAEGVRTEGDTIRDRTQNSSADLLSGRRPSAASLATTGFMARKRSPCRKPPQLRISPDARRRGTWRPMRTGCLNRSARVVKTMRRRSPHLGPSVRAPGGKAGRVQDPRVSDRNAGTHVSPPVVTTPASSAESSDDDARGRSSRSSPRPVTPATWRRGTDVESGASSTRGVVPIPVKPGGTCGAGSPALITSGLHGGVSRAIAALAQPGWTG